MPVAGTLLLCVLYQVLLEIVSRIHDALLSTCCFEMMDVQVLETFMVSGSALNMKLDSVAN